MGAYQPGPSAQGCACGADVTQIQIGEFVVGIAALRSILATFYRSGRRPEPALANELLEMVKIYNYVAPNSVEEYKAALLREYTKYWNARQPSSGDGRPVQPPTSAIRHEPRIKRMIGMARRLVKRTGPTSGHRL